MKKFLTIIFACTLASLLHGQPSGPIISLSQNSYYFDYVKVGNTDTFKLGITNPGTSDLIITGVDITIYYEYWDSTSYYIYDSCAFRCSYTGTIQAGASDTAIILFSPDTVIEVCYFFNAILFFIDNAISGNDTINLSGDAYPANHSVESFESTPVPPQGWYASANWVVCDSVALSGTHSLYCPSKGTIDTLIFPILDLTVAPNIFTFHLKGYNPNSSMDFYISDDAGNSWINWGGITPLLFPVFSYWIVTFYPQPSSDSVRYMITFISDSTDTEGIYIDDVILPPLSDFTTELASVENKDYPLNLFPNPATEQITFISSDKGILTITNQLGQVVYSSFIYNELTQINTDKIQAGIYFVTFQTDRQKTTSKLIIQ